MAILALALCACEDQCQTSGIDRQHRLEQLRIDEANNYRLRERPSPMGPGCDVCPTWCKRLDLSPRSAAALLSMYRRGAQDYFNRAESRRGWHQVEAVACIVKSAAKDGDEALVQEFLTLLEDPSAYVRYCAAVHAVQHGLDVERGVAVLRQLASMDAGSLAMDAAVQLVHWEGKVEVEL